MKELLLISLGLGLVPISLLKLSMEEENSSISYFIWQSQTSASAGGGFFGCCFFCLLVCFFNLCVEFLLSLPGVWPNSAPTELRRNLVKLKTFKVEDAFCSCSVCIQEIQVRI